MPVRRRIPVRFPKSCFATSSSRRRSAGSLIDSRPVVILFLWHDRHPTPVRREPYDGRMHSYGEKKSREENRQWRIPTVSATLRDGGLVELVYDADRNETAFIVADHGDWQRHETVALDETHTLVVLAQQQSDPQQGRPPRVRA